MRIKYFTLQSIVLLVSILLYSCNDNNTPSNVAPTLHTGRPQVAIEQSKVTVSGIASDVDGTIVSYSWRQISGMNVTINNSKSANASFIIPAMVSANVDRLIFELEITDNDGAQTTAKALVDIFSIGFDLQFSDERLKKCVLSGLIKQNLQYAENLDQLFCRGVSNLDGIEYLTSLRNLTITGLNNGHRVPLTGVLELSPLAALTGLVELNLSGNYIKDIWPLQDLTKLTELNLYLNQIEDISPLQGLTSISWLSLGANRITDISILENLTSLKQLLLFHNPIENFKAIINLGSLTELGLDSANISDLSPLGNLNNLTHLFIGHNHFTDLSPLLSLTQLIYVDISYNENLFCEDLHTLETILSSTLISRFGECKT